MARVAAGEHIERLDPPPLPPNLGAISTMSGPPGSRSDLRAPSAPGSESSAAAARKLNHAVLNHQNKVVLRVLATLPPNKSMSQWDLSIRTGYEINVINRICAGLRGCGIDYIDGAHASHKDPSLRVNGMRISDQAVDALARADYGRRGVA